MDNTSNKLTRHFSYSEFDCRCGCVMPPHVKKRIGRLALRLEVIRAQFEKPLYITSGYRCKEHNKSVGGAPASRHMDGIAADFVVLGVSPAAVQDKVVELMRQGCISKGGIGKYKTFTHYDRRGWSVIF